MKKTYKVIDLPNIGAVYCISAKSGEYAYTAGIFLTSAGTFVAPGLLWCRLSYRSRAPWILPKDTAFFPNTVFWE